MANPRICYVDDCSKPGRHAGLCSMHYARKRRHGDVSHTENGRSLRWIEAHASYDGDDCLIPPFSRNRDGYAVMRDHFKGRGTILASRVMAILAHGEPPTSKHYACHSCHKGKNGCVNPKHLYWGTNRDNQMDRIDAGNSNRGSRHGNAKLSEQDVIGIRRMKSEGAKVADISAIYGVAVSTVYAVLNGGIWGWHS